MLRKFILSRDQFRKEGAVNTSTATEIRRMRSLNLEMRKPCVFFFF